MSEDGQDRGTTPDAGYPNADETLPEGSPTAGEAALRKGDVEVEGPKSAQGGHETHGAGEHDDPNA